MKPDTITVMLVEDSREYRKVINLALGEETEMELIGEFGTAEFALRRIQDPLAAKPQIILLDLRLPGMKGLEALPHFKNYLPEAKIIVLTQSDSEEDVLQAISLGASGYLLKSATLHEIVDGIRSVVKGGASLDANVARIILENMKQRIPRKPKVELSHRELEILQLLGEGLVKKEIAQRLNISYSTVDTHVGHIYEKLHVTNAPSAVNMAHRMGIFPNE